MMTTLDVEDRCACMPVPISGTGYSSSSSVMCVGQRGDLSERIISYFV